LTQSCKLVEEPVEGSDCITAKSEELAVEPGIYIVVELKACNSKEGDPVPAQ
jgi:hypothetical protein